MVKFHSCSMKTSSSRTILQFTKRPTPPAQYREMCTTASQDLFLAVFKNKMKATVRAIK